MWFYTRKYIPYTIYQFQDYSHSFPRIFLLYSGSGDFTRIFLSKRDRARPSLFYTRAWHNLGKSLGEGLGLLCALFTSLSLSLPLYLSLSLSLLLSLLLCLPLSLSYLSLPLYISPSTFLSLSFLLSLFSLSFSLAYLMNVFVLV